MRAGRNAALLTVRPIALATTRPLRQAVLRPYMSVDELAGHEPPGSVAFGVSVDDALVAVGLVGREGGPGAWRIRGMATVPEARGRGAGTAVLSALVEHAVSNGATRIWCNARIGARSLYERAGFRAVSEQFDVPRTGPHYVMELTIGAERRGMPGGVQ